MLYVNLEFGGRVEIPCSLMTRNLMLVILLWGICITDIFYVIPIPIVFCPIVNRDENSASS